MEPKRLVGPGAGSAKYDVLTALTVFGLQGTSGLQVSMARLCSLITARYNWKLDHFCVGQPEMARMWGVNERTVKREIKRWTDERLLICIRKGVRGRVGAYRLNMPRVFVMSREIWPLVGPDFDERMQTLSPAETSSVIKIDFGKAPDPPVAVPLPCTWEAVQARLRELYPGKYHNWFAPLKFVSDKGDRYVLAARSGFVVQYLETHFLPVLSEAVETEVGPGRRIVLTVAD